MTFFAIAAALVTQRQRLFFVDTGLLSELGYDTSPKAPDIQGLLEFSPEPSIQSSRVRSFYVVPPKVLKKSILRRAVTQLAQFLQPDEAASESLRLIRMSNLLQPLGKLGAIEALLTYDQGSGYPNDRRLRWLPNSIFVSPTGTSASQAEGKHLLISARYPGWPMYPMLKLTGIPFVVRANRIEIENGDPQFFCVTWQILSLFKDWSFLATPINPPDDPFLAFDELAGNSEWKSLDWHVFANQKEYAKDMREDLKSEILKLTATVFDRNQSQLGPGEPSAAEHFDEFHKEFLRLGGHWDPKLQMYVARLPDESKTR